MLIASGRGQEVGMAVAAGWKLFRTGVSTYRAELRFSLRMTIAAVSAFALGQVLAIPLHGLWVVLTAAVVTQISVGGSLRATADYVIGTLGGAVYASAVALIIPHPTPLATAGVLALAIAPMAAAAALNPRFRVAPFTAVLVVLIASQLGEGPIESALYRLLEVALGGAVALAVSFLVVPERAHGLGLDAAARVLDQLARVLGDVLAGFTRKIDLAEVARIQNEAGAAVARFQAIAAEVQRERLVNLVPEPDPAPLSRTLLRLRHDLVMFGRAAIVPLPDAIGERVGPLLGRIAASAGDYLRECGAALVSRSLPPPRDAVEAALDAYTSALAAIRREGLTHSLSDSEVERIFALGFALEQLRHNCTDLQRCVEEWAQPPR